MSEYKRYLEEMKRFKDSTCTCPFICDSFLDISNITFSLIINILEIYNKNNDNPELDENFMNKFGFEINKCIEKNVIDKVALFEQTVNNQNSYEILNGNQINKILKKFGLNNKLFDDIFSVEIDSFREEEKGSDEYISYLRFIFNSNIFVHYQIYPHFTLQGCSEFAEISNLFLDELKYDVCQIEDPDEDELEYSSNEEKNKDSDKDELEDSSNIDKIKDPKNQDNSQLDISLTF